MPIDPERALAAEPVVTHFEWSPDDAILYALGVGAGLGAATDPAELRYLYEVDLAVLPTFGVVPPFSALWGVNNIPGVDINLMMVLHGEQDLTVHDTIPTEAEVVNRSSVVEVQDKGRAAVVKLAVETELEDGTPLFSNVFSIFARGEGGFGGDAGESVEIAVPERSPDATTKSPTMEHQALIYRLSGDRNPLHADPAFASMAGFDRPILHGLCSYGIVGKAVLDTMLDGDVGRFGGFRSRFSGVVFPGETIVTEMWEGDDGIIVRASTEERGEPVLTNALVRVGG